MRKMVFAFCVGAALLCGCEKPLSGQSRAEHDGYNVVTIEGCEYIECDYGAGTCRVYSLTHKGNCSNPIHNYEKK